MALIPACGPRRKYVDGRRRWAESPLVVERMTGALEQQRQLAD